MQQRCRPLYGEQSGEKKNSIPSISSHLPSPDVLLSFRLLFLSYFFSIFSVSLFISILLCSHCFAAVIILSFHIHPASSPLLLHDFRPCVDIQDALFTFMGPCIVLMYSSITNKMQRYTVVFITINALHVSGGSSAHHQELKTVYTASGICRVFTASYRLLT